ncbi:MAG: hypothetical protein ACXAB8_20595, partial [Promethearchaeota archaeon]
HNNTGDDKKFGDRVRCIIFCGSSVTWQSFLFFPTQSQMFKSKIFIKKSDFAGYLLAIYGIN